MSRTDRMKIIIIKRNIQGEETWRYEGSVLEQGSNFIKLEAFFNRPDILFHGILFKEGDRFIETYYTDRWYNIDEIHDCQDDQIKGWYCNITYPAVIQTTFYPRGAEHSTEPDSRSVSYVDLALDLLVYPDGRQLVLDEDEFLDLPLIKEDAQQARSSLTELQALFHRMSEGHS